MDLRIYFLSDITEIAIWNHSWNPWHASYYFGTSLEPSDIYSWFNPLYIYWIHYQSLDTSFSWILLVKVNHEIKCSMKKKIFYWHLYRLWYNHEINYPSKLVSTKINESTVIGTIYESTVIGTIYESTDLYCIL